MPDAAIYVLAGVNGAGKSSVLGSALAEAGLDFYNPDLAARELIRDHPELGQERANSLAWQQMRRHLEDAILNRTSYAFESTLGGKTIPHLLAAALEGGIEVHVWYIGLNSPEHHLVRVRQRVAEGGHDIPETHIRKRYVSSRANLIRLLPGLTTLKVFDNNQDAWPARPELVLDVEAGMIKFIAEDNLMPPWARPIAGALNDKTGPPA